MPFRMMYWDIVPVPSQNKTKNGGLNYLVKMRPFVELGLQGIVIISVTCLVFKLISKTELFSKIVPSVPWLTIPYKFFFTTTVWLAEPLLITVRGGENIDP